MTAQTESAPVQASEKEPRSVGPDIDGSLETYQLSRSLQSALFGGVYEARGLSTGTMFAIKVLHKSELKRAAKHPHHDFCEIPLSEIRFQEQMRRLPHVVEVIEAFEDRWCHYIVFDLGTGGDLLEALKKKPSGFAEPNAQYLIRMAAQGLNSLHSRNLAMQDVSLENMLVFPDSTQRAWIKVCDPGQAVLFDRNDNGEELPVSWRGQVGKSFRPPELFQNKPYMSTKVDSWCLGWSTFYLLVAQPLFMSVDMNDNGWRQFQSGDFSSLVNRKTMGSERATLSAKAQDFIFRLMDIDPNTRMSINDALSHPWLTAPSTDIPPLLLGPDLQLLDPPLRRAYQPEPMMSDVQSRGRNTIAKGPPMLRGTSPIQIPNLRARLPLPRQGSPLGFMPPSRGSLGKPSIPARSLSPPQILIRPREIAAPQFAWNPVAASPSPPPRQRTPRQRAPMPIQIDGSKKDAPAKSSQSSWTWSGRPNPKEKPTTHKPPPVMNGDRKLSNGAIPQGQVPVNSGRSSQGPPPGSRRSVSPFTFAGLQPLSTKPTGRFVWDSALTRVDPSPAPPGAQANGHGSPTPERGLENPAARGRAFGASRGLPVRVLSPGPTGFRNGRPGQLSRFDLHQRALSPMAPLLKSNVSLNIRALSPTPTPKGYRNFGETTPNVMKWNPTAA